MAIPVPTVDAAGMTIPEYAAILSGAQDGVWSIYGSDVDLDADTQDGQFLAIFSQALSDAYQIALDTYNAYSPSTAQGAGLSNAVKINGIQRNTASHSVATVSVGGVVGTIINNGVVGDNLGLGTRWALPASITIPGSGTINVVATCTEEGNTAAGAATLTEILTPTLGWQTSTNAAAATAGNAVETDAALRRRQTQSTAISAETPYGAIYAAIANVPGVGRLRLYENDSDLTDGDGIPSHSISAVLSGDSSVDVPVAQAIANKKAPGVGTYGTTSEVVVDPVGVPNTINFFKLSEKRMLVNVTVQSLTGYVATTTNAIKESIAAYLSGLDIGEDSYLTRLYTAANLNGSIVGSTYVVTVLQQSISPAGPTAADVAIAFNAAATCAISDIAVTVL